MTVPTEAAFVALAWTGSEQSFAPGFPIAQASDLLVYSRDDTTQVITPLTLGTQFAVAIDSASKLPTVTPIALPSAPKTLMFLRDTDAIQATAFANLASYLPDVHQVLHDAAAMRSAEEKFHRGRGLIAPLGETGQVLPAAAARANKRVHTDAAGLLMFSDSDAAIWLTGSAAPAPADGKERDLYLRTNGEVYLKSGGAWTLIADITGPTGPAGNNLFSVLPELIKTANYGVGSGDRGKRIVGNSASAITFDLPLTANATEAVYLFGNIGTGNVTLDPAGAELIDGAATYLLALGDDVLVYEAAGAWRVVWLNSVYDERQIWEERRSRRLATFANAFTL